MSTKTNNFVNYGFEGCRYFIAAHELLKKHVAKNKTHTLQVVAVPYAEWHVMLANVPKRHKLLKTHVEKVAKHKTSPLIIKNHKYIGGHDALCAHLQ